jgi:hypothetical protein
MRSRLRGITIAAIDQCSSREGSVNCPQDAVTPIFVMVNLLSCMAASGRALCRAGVCPIGKRIPSTERLGSWFTKSSN